jgi:hypothetical protein
MTIRTALSFVLLAVGITGCGDSSAGAGTPTPVGDDAAAGSDAQAVADGGSQGEGGADSGAGSDGGPGDSGGSADGPASCGATCALPCDIAASGGTPCVVAYSMARLLFRSYGGYLFELQRDSDKATKDIGTVGGLADVSAAGSFCVGTTCHVIRVYDQTSYRLDGINSVRSDSAVQPVPPVFLTMQIQGKTFPYWSNGFLQAGSRANSALGNGAMPVGSAPVTEYAIAVPVNGPGACCYDFGEAEANISDTGNGHMFALNLGPLQGVGMDLENGGIYGSKGSGTGGASTPYVVLGKTDGVSLFTLKYGLVGDPLKAVAGGAPYCSGTLTFYNQKLSCFGYGPLQLEGGLTIGIGGDGSGAGQATGSFIEGIVIAAQTSDATDDSIQASTNALFGP